MLKVLITKILRGMSYQSTKLTEIQIINVRETNYIKTVNDSTLKDNLGNSAEVILKSKFKLRLITLQQL